jgi:hypothetical protein
MRIQTNYKRYGKIIGEKINTFISGFRGQECPAASAPLVSPLLMGDIRLTV